MNAEVEIMPMPPDRKTIAAFALVVLFSAIPPLTLAASSSAASSSLCQEVRSTMVSKALGVKATKVTTDINGDVTVCWYKVGANSQAVYLRSQTSDNLAGFNADRKLAGSEGENPRTDTGFKPFAAFSTTVGSPSYGVTYSVVVLKKGTELEVGASNVTLPKVEGLAKNVLPLV